MILERAKKSREIALGPYNSTPLYTSLACHQNMFPIKTRTIGGANEM
jgi:hypothetical protein